MTKTTTTAGSSSEARPPLSVRWATPDDVASQVEVERLWRHEKEDCWGHEDLLDYLPSRRHGRGSLVAVHHVRGVVGHLQLVSRDADVVVSNLATHPAYVRLGVARRLVGTLTTTLPVKYRRGRVNTVVRERDLQSQQFFRAAGFRCLSVLPAFFSLPEDGGYHFQYREAEAECPQEKAGPPGAESSPPTR